MLNVNDRDAILILNAVNGLGFSRINKLVDFFGSPAAVVNAVESDLLLSKILPETVINNFLKFDKLRFLEEEKRLLTKHGVDFFVYTDADFPAALKKISDRPAILYFRGSLKKIPELAVAIVGSRHASIYGLSVADKFAVRLASLGITVVSGMARGIDTAAHTGAVRVKGQTIAVLGSGLANLYPPENKKLAEDISHIGAVISEFPMTAEPLAQHFPRRNRIISGLSLGVIVVEAAQRSGALITADIALEQNKEVFAVPGKVDSPTASGTNHLIKQGAKLITCIEDVLEELSLPISQCLSENNEIDAASEEIAVNNNVNELTEPQQMVYALLKSNSVHIDELAKKIDIPVSKLNVILLELELKKMIKQLPGKMFKKDR
ncbi:MAG: DNA-protecting protein DprA [Candidatus Omnitrophica bacterium]|nr:DNA-protecting protein DprA [Candidatus Omnitrophota bacterium]